MKRWLLGWMAGVMMFSTRAVTIAVNAAPMMMPTAMSITLPWLMNSWNSAMSPFFSPSAMLFLSLRRDHE